MLNYSYCLNSNQNDAMLHFSPPLYTQEFDEVCAIDTPKQTIVWVHVVFSPFVGK